MVDFAALFPNERKSPKQNTSSALEWTVPGDKMYCFFVTTYSRLSFNIGGNE